MTTWDVTAGFLVVGSGGGALVGALRAGALGKDVVAAGHSAAMTKSGAASAAPGTKAVPS